MRYGSVCSGIEAATMAWHGLGWEPAFFSEIEAFPKAVLAHRYPETPCHGDFTTIGSDDYGAIDLLVGGTPCQSFSVAGLRKGMDDDRGNLALEFIKLIDRKRPEWVVWENVPGVLSSNSGKDFGSFLGALAEIGYGFAYRVLDAQFFGVAQRRRRVFVVANATSWQRAAAVLFERESVFGDFEAGRKAREEAARGVGSGIDSRVWPAETACTLNAAFGSKLGLEDQHINGGASLFVPDVVGALCARTGRSMSVQDADQSHIVCQPIALAGNTIGRKPENGGNHTGYDDSGTCYTLTAADRHGVSYATTHRMINDGVLDNVSGTLPASLGTGGVDMATKPMALEQKVAVCFAQNSRNELREMPYSGALSANPGMKQTSYVRAGSVVRRLTPTECERLQGFPDDFTLIPYRNKSAANCPDGPRYKALGNSMAVPVMKWIGERIQTVDKLV